MSWSRALLVVAACLGGALSLSITASADDGRSNPATDQQPPRAQPVARSFVTSTFAPSLSKLIDQSIAAAGDLTTAARRAGGVATERAAVVRQYNQVRVAAQGGISADENGAADLLAPVVAQLAAKDAALAADQAVYEQSGIWSLPSADAKWTMPVKGGEISQGFGPTSVSLEPARTWGGVAYAHFHDGLDIAAPFGAPVVAAAPGQVIFVGHLADGAYVVMVASIGGYVAEYAHLDDRVASPVRAGDMVAAGQAIGRVGLTGMTTGPHLHLQTWHWGALTDPLSFIGG